MFNFHPTNIPGSRATRGASRAAVSGRIQTFPVSDPPGRSRIGLAVATALAGVGSPLAPPVLAADVSAGALQEVVVTARKREENLQDVPISMNVLTKDDLQHLGIAKFEDYVTKVPSLSFISVGPGLQTLYIRGVSDGSKPNVSNTSATGYFLDDSSLSWYGAQPDLHLYDIERIEVLNGPQGTTFGAGSMSGAVRFITVKPDVNAFSMGVDFDGAQIQDGRQNWTYEGFLNAPLIQGRLGLRLSGFALSKGGFIDNLLTTRTWKNGVVSNNAAWARNDYNREHQDGGRIALKGILNDRWSGDLTFTYQRQSFDGAWDQDVLHYSERRVSRFGPESRSAEARILNFHVDGDVGIGDLVFASTYWSLPTRQANEYSEYMENVSAPAYNLPAGYLEALACDTGPTKTNPTQSYSGCNVPIQYYENHANPERWSNEVRLASKPGGRLHWLGGLYWEKTRDKNSGSTYYIPGLKYGGEAFQSYAASPFLPKGVWYSGQERSDYLQGTEFANISFDFTESLSVEAGVVHFHSDFKYYYPYGGYTWDPITPVRSTTFEGSSQKWNSRFGINYKATNHVMLYGIFSQGFRDGGSNGPLPNDCPGVPPDYVPDTLNNYELGWKMSALNGRFIWNGATYLMEWKDLQTLIYDFSVCPPSTFNANVGDARIYGAESNIDWKLSESWSLQASAAYTDAHLVSSKYLAFEGNVGERLPYVPYFNYSANVRYEHALGARLRGYAQFDLAHKGDMWNDLHVEGSNGLPRMLQPAYTIMNLRFGLHPAGSHWLAELYVTNLTDKNAIIYTNTGNWDLRQTVCEPRAIGVRLNYRFGKLYAGTQ